MPSEPFTCIVLAGLGNVRSCQQSATLEDTSENDYYTNNNNNNTSICKAHNVSIRAESEAPVSYEGERKGGT